MTYVNENLRAFLERTAFMPLKRRSEGRLKAYLSAEDLRAWDFSVDHRRKQILDTVKRDINKCDGQMIKVILAFMRNKFMNEVKECFKSYWTFVNKLELSDDDKQRLQCFERQLGGIFNQLTAKCNCAGEICFKCICDAEPCDCREDPCTCAESSLIDDTFTKKSSKTAPGPSKTQGIKTVTKITGKKGSNNKNCGCIVVKAQVNKKPSSSNKKVYEICSLFERSLTNPEQFNKFGFEWMLDSDKSLKKLSDSLQERKSLFQKEQNTLSSLKSGHELLASKIKDCLKELDKLKDIGGENEEEKKSRTHLTILEKFCNKLKNIEIENKKLRKQKDLLKKKMSPVMIRNETNDKDKKYDELKEECEMLKRKLAMYEEENKVNKVNKEKNVVYKDCSTMLDNTLAERDEMLKTLEKLKETEEELAEYKEKASKVDGLEREVRSLTNINKAIEFDFQKVRSECGRLNREISNLKSEREVLKKRLVSITNEHDFYKGKAKEGEIIKMERDKLQIKLNDLNHVQVNNDNLRLKCKSLENLVHEVELYKQKYEELLGMQQEYEIWKTEIATCENLKKENDSLQVHISDLELVILDQETEINKLHTQIESIFTNKDNLELSMSEELKIMRSEIEEKDEIISNSEVKLEKVQAELQNTIQGVSDETVRYKTRLEELEKELFDAKAKEEIKRLESCYDENKSNVDYESLIEIRNDLEAAKRENEKLQEFANKMNTFTGDEHVQEILKHSESAVKKVTATLSKQYKEWDMTRRRHRSRSSTVGNKQVFKRTTIKINNLENLKKTVGILESANPL